MAIIFKRGYNIWEAEHILGIAWIKGVLHIGIGIFTISFKFA